MGADLGIRRVQRRESLTVGHRDPPRRTQNRGTGVGRARDAAQEPAAHGSGGHASLDALALIAVHALMAVQRPSRALPVVLPSVFTQR